MKTICIRMRTICMSMKTICMSMGILLHMVHAIHCTYATLICTGIEHLSHMVYLLRLGKYRLYLTECPFTTKGQTPLFKIFHKYLFPFMLISVPLHSHLVLSVDFFFPSPFISSCLFVCCRPS